MDYWAADRESKQCRNQLVINIYEQISPCVWADYFMQVHEKYAKSDDSVRLRWITYIYSVERHPYRMFDSLYV